MHTIFEEENKIQLLKGHNITIIFFIKRKKIRFRISICHNLEIQLFPKTTSKLDKKNALKFEFSERT